MNPDEVKNIARLIMHREQFMRETFLQDRGYKVQPSCFYADGYRDPHNGEILDLETAYAQESVRLVLEAEQSAGEVYGD